MVSEPEEEVATFEDFGVADNDELAVEVVNNNFLEDNGVADNETSDNCAVDNCM
jgi:hypothetical protein